MVYNVTHMGMNNDDFAFAFPYVNQIKIGEFAPTNK